MRKPSLESLSAVPTPVIELDDSGDESGDLGYVMENIKEDPYAIHQTEAPLICAAHLLKWLNLCQKGTLTKLLQNIM